MTLEEYKEQYKTAIEARNFHYQNFSIWTAYFSVIVGALFVAFYNVDDNTFSMLVAFIGFVVSLCWHWSNKGYTYWWHHWSMFLDDMENNMSKAYEGVQGSAGNKGNKGNEESLKVEISKELSGRVYSVFYDVKSSFLCPVMPANISTSKVALLMSFIISVAWAYLICISFFNGCGVERLKYFISGFVAIIGTLIISSLLSMCFKSDLSGHHIISQKDRINNNNKNQITT